MFNLLVVIWLVVFTGLVFTAFESRIEDGFKSDQSGQSMLMPPQKKHGHPWTALDNTGPSNLLRQRSSL